MLPLITRALHGLGRSCRSPQLPSLTGVKVLESHLGHTLFDRNGRGVTLNACGKACLGEVQRFLSDIRDVVDRYRVGAHKQHLSLVAVESIADRWLMPKIAEFSALRPEIAIELETDHLVVDPNRQDFDIWITYDGGTRAPSVEVVLRETLFEYTLLPVCSPALFESRGRPRRTCHMPRASASAACCCKQP